MAIRYAIANGNWSSTATWDNGASLGIPTTGDDVYSNNFTVNVNQSFEVATLRSTALAAQDSRLNPIMTSNTTPSGIASASSNAATDFPWEAFDNQTGVGNSWIANAGVPQWLQYQFTTSLIVRSYSIFYSSAQTGRPTSFNLQGSNDGVSFTTLDTRTSFVFTNNQYNTLTITNPTSSFSTYRLNITATDSGNPCIIDMTLNEAGASVVAGGSFNFNSGSISGSVTSASPLSPGATNLITVTATTGSVGLTLGGVVTSPTAASTNLISHTGNCDFRLSGTTFNVTNAGLSSQICINKSSLGTIIITGSLNAGSPGGGQNTSHTLSSTAGNTIILGNLTGGGGTGTAARGVNQTAGNLTVIGNVVGGNGSGAGQQGIFFTGTSISIIGNAAGSAVQEAINTTGPVFVTGNVTGSAAAGIVTTAPAIVTGSVVAQGSAAAINAGSTATFINISGSVISSATANAINATNASAVVNLAGNMVNTSGKTAIYCQNLFLSDTATTQAQFVTVGSQDRTLYSADTFPNLPSASNVRFGTTYGPGSGNTGTLRMASPQDVRSGVLTDNTTGSAILSIESLSNEVQTSSDPFAQRLRNIATVDIVGNLLTAFKK